MRVVAGIDAGATRTRAVLVSEEGVFIGRGMADRACYGADSMGAIKNSLKQALAGAMDNAILQVTTIDSIFVGIAGVVTEQDQGAVAKLVRDFPFVNKECVSIDHDIRIAHAGGLAGDEGIVVIAGTGSSCYGRDKTGMKWQAGGWQFLLDDIGSAYWISIEGMKAMVQAYDGRGRKTSLSAMLCDTLDLTTVPDIIRRLHVDGLFRSKCSMSKAEIASVAPAVLEEAACGDEVAHQIVVRGVKGLVDMVRAVAENLEIRRDDLLVTSAGGLLSGSDLMYKEFCKALSRVLPGAKLVKPRLEPVFGASLLALDMIGVSPDEKIVKSLTELLVENQ